MGRPTNVRGSRSTCSPATTPEPSRGVVIIGTSVFCFNVEKARMISLKFPQDFPMISKKFSYTNRRGRCSIYSTSNFTASIKNIGKAAAHAAISSD